MHRRLTNAQLLFLDALLADPKQNRTKAAIAAGISEKRAAQTAYDWMNAEKYRHVQVEHKRRIDELVKKLDITVEDTWRGIAAIVKADIRECVQWGTNDQGRDFCRYTPQDQVPENHLAIVKQVTKFSTPYGETVSLVFHDKLEALKLLAKMQGLTRESLDVDITIRQAETAGKIRSKLLDLIPEAETDCGDDRPGTGESGV